MNYINLVVHVVMHAWGSSTLPYLVPISQLNIHWYHIQSYIPNFYLYIMHVFLEGDPTILATQKHKRTHVHVKTLMSIIFLVVVTIIVIIIVVVVLVVTICLWGTPLPVLF